MGGAAMSGSVKAFIFFALVAGACHVWAALSISTLTSQIVENGLSSMSASDFEDFGSQGTLIFVLQLIAFIISAIMFWVVLSRAFNGLKSISEIDHTVAFWPVVVLGIIPIVNLIAPWFWIARIDSALNRYPESGWRTGFASVGWVAVLFAAYSIAGTIIQIRANDPGYTESAVTDTFVFLQSAAYVSLALFLASAALTSVYLAKVERASDAAVRLAYERERTAAAT